MRKTAELKIRLREGMLIAFVNEKEFSSGAEGAFPN